ncbi:hypothetical protein I6F33_10230 [Bradyrhizobium sp. BRP20]|uniref:hypothetical protein n=1 Tax=Bradyrhizobium sp. BRP20 TaxID=2793822 RepID=UPI001CD6B527|nr:hypothetical protein [Bradyrhizobium sp. BRP20]MCA1433354.1 hypothetical protein [Bradyrhizobium sp. BRP20]
MERHLKRGEKPQLQRVIGCHSFGQEAVGFALPIFSRSTQTIAPLIQVIDEISGQITGFRVLEGPKLQFLLARGPSAALGDEQIYAFIAAPGKFHFGTLDTLRTRLEHFAEANASRAGLVLQIRELIGSPQEKKSARIRMRRILLDEQGSEAAKSFYEGSVLRSVLWRCLVSGATDREMATRILNSRGRLSAEIKTDGSIAIDISALSSEDQAAIDRKVLSEKILLEFDPQPTGTIRARDDYRLNFEQDAKNLLDQLARIRRQEERMAVLMSTILDNPLVGKAALVEYGRDRAKFADWTVKELRKIFMDTNWPSDERVIATLVPKLFTKQYPLARGDLLLYLARHLAKWPVVKSAIQKCLERTNSMLVDLQRAEIEKALSKGEPRDTSVRPIL